MTTTRRFGFCEVLLLVLFVLMVAPLAHAAGREAKERAARKACLSGDYTKGAEILSDLFIDTKDANYIFNQARCFEQNSHCEEAISRFREYLRKATGLSPEEKADTERHIADCQALLGPKDAPAPAHARASEAATAPKTEAGSVVYTPAIPSAAPSPPPASPALSPTVASSEQLGIASATAPAANSGRGLRIAGITCGAVGVASVGTAIYFYTRAKSYSDKVSNEAIPISSDQQAGKNAQTMQWVFYSVGAAAITTGAVLYLLGWSSRGSDHTVAGVSPILGLGMAGISAQGAF